MKKSLLLATLVMLGACKQVEIDQIIVKRSATLNGSLSAQIELGDEKLNLDLADQESTLNFDTKKISSLDMKLSFKNQITINSSKFDPSAKIYLSGKISEKSVKIKDGEVKINGDKLSDVNCKNTINVEKISKTLVLDLTKFDSLASCKGDDIDLYKASSVGDRDLNPNEDSLLRGNYFSLEDDEKFGKEFTDNFLKTNSKSVLDTDHPTSEYIQELMQRIADVSDMPDLAPKAYVINANIMNAFALPGGYVFVFRGLIDKVQDESELVGVLGHEWAHVTARHGTENMSRSIRAIGSALILAAAAQGVAAVKKEDKYKLIADLVGGAAIGGAYLSILNKGRKAELEADRIGSQYSQRLNFEPWGIAKMFQTFKKESSNNEVTTLEKLMSSHPQHDDRINQVATLSSMFYTSDRGNYVVSTNDFDFARGELLKIAADTNYGSDITGKAFVDSLNAKIKAEINSHVKDEEE
jgi:Zn-dependent protease with chaperone function